MHNGCDVVVKFVIGLDVHKHLAQHGLAPSMLMKEWLDGNSYGKD